MTTKNVVGLTGGIGAGKSTAAAILGDFGAIIVDCDQIGRDVVTPSGGAYRRLIAHFGPHIVSEDGSINRPSLAKIVFSNPGQLEKLNQITHPAMNSEIRKVIEQSDVDDVVVLDMAILVESELGAGQYNHVLVIETPMDIRLNRLVSTRHMDLEDAKARIAQQATDAERRVAADSIINNDAGVDELRHKLHAWWKTFTISSGH